MASAQDSPSAGGQDAPLGSEGRRLPAAAGADEPLPGAAPTIHDLPDEMLGHILAAAVGQEKDWGTGQAAAQVCKRWNAVFYSDSCSEPWRSFSWTINWGELADGQLMAAGLRLFERIGHLIETAEFGAEPQARMQQAAAPHLPAFLATLNPAAVTGLTIQQVPLVPAALQALLQFRQLRQLAVAAPEFAVDMEGLVDVVRQLDGLQEFKFRGSSVSESLLAAVCQLPALQRLELHSTGAPLPDLSPLTALAGSLTTLCLVEREREEGSLQLPQAAAFPHLRKLFVAAPVLQVPGAGLLEAATEDGIWDLEELEEGDEDVAITDSWLLPAPAFGFELCDGGLSVDVWNAQLEAGQLAAMLASAVPRGQLLQLSFRVCSLGSESFQGCAARLATARELRVVACTGRYDDVAEELPLQAALEAVLRQTPALRSLTVFCPPAADDDACLSDGLPPAVAALRHLTSLVLISARLPHLDGVLDGLPGLAHLDLRLNHLEQLPDSLSRCTKLTALLLGGNDDLTPDGLDEETACLLAALPALAQLQLPRTAASDPDDVGDDAEAAAEDARSLLAECGGSHIREVTVAKAWGLDADAH